MGSLSIALLASAACDGGPAGNGGAGGTFSPAADTTLSGSYTFDRIVIPAGVTVTASDDLDLQVADSVHIAGQLLAVCHEIRLVASGHVVVLGRIANGCGSASAASAPPLEIVADGNLTLIGAELVSGGNITIRDDATLTAPTALGPSARARSLTPAQDEFVYVRSITIRTEPSRAADGVEGPTGTAGASGAAIRLLFRRDAVFEGTSAIRAQSGGNGGIGVHGTDGVAARAVGGGGGEGGAISLVSGGFILAPTLNALTLVSGAGGRGGDARAIVAGTGAAPAAEADAGTGGSTGRVLVQADSFSVGVGGLLARVSSAGGGGDAEAQGGEGRAASTTEAPSDGGPAIARGGSGASIAADAVRVIGAAANSVGIGGNPPGAGGRATASGGTGGTGSVQNPSGGRGGTVEARGGSAGSIALLDELGRVAFVGATGGAAVFAGGSGGVGGNGCAAGAPGGTGGSGGDAVGAGGLGGAGRFGGQAGVVVHAGVGNGGTGGSGTPPGAGGAPGANRIVVRGVRTIEAPSFQPGAPGAPCSL